MIIRPYNPLTDEGFVFSSFALQTAEPDQKLRDLLDAGAKVLVAESPTEKHPSGKPLAYGWAAAFEGALVYAYCKHDLRRFPVTPQLLEALDLDPSNLRVLFPTRQIAAMAMAWDWTPANDNGISDERREQQAR